MKRLLYLSILLVAVACKREPLTVYDVNDNIYFGNPASIGYYVDSLVFTFAYSDASVKDTILSLPLSVTGPPAEKDRQYKLVVDPASTVALGTHYELPDLVIRAGRVRDTLRVRLKRAPDLTSTVKKLILRLQPNENFNTKVLYRIQRNINIDTADVLKFTISVSDILSAGPYWDINYARYFGKFSLKKVRLIHDMLGMPLDFWSYEYPSPQQRSAAVYYASVTGRYLSDEAALGNIILDEDGTPMKMGPGY